MPCVTSGTQYKHFQSVLAITSCLWKKAHLKHCNVIIGHFLKAIYRQNLFYFIKHFLPNQFPNGTILCFCYFLRFSLPFSWFSLNSTAANSKMCDAPGNHGGIMVLNWIHLTTGFPNVVVLKFWFAFVFNLPDRPNLNQLTYQNPAKICKRFARFKKMQI